MTTAGADTPTPDLADVVLPELPSPPTLAGRSPGRAARIAAVHMAAHWLAEHQLVQAPQYVDLRHHINPSDEADPATRLAAVEAFAAAHDVEVQYSGSTVFATYTLATKEVHGVQIDYSVLTSVSDRREAWDR